MRPRKGVGALLYAWRQHRGLSQIQAAAKAGTHASALCWWETGERRPSVEQLAALSEALEATDAEFDAAVAALLAKVRT